MAAVGVATIRSRLASALSAYLGTYTFPSGNTDPAIRIDAGIHHQALSGVAQETPQPTVTGLECVIQPDTDASFTPLLGQEYRYETTITITLKQWDLTATVQAASTALIRELRDLLDTVGPRIPRNSAFDSLEQQVFTIVQSQGG